MVHFENHCSGSDPFTIPATTLRENWYGVGGYPTVKIDGKYEMVGGLGGGDACVRMAGYYRDIINQRRAETGGVSPVEITGTFLPLESSVTATATFRLVDPVSLTNLRATLLVYEDDVFWCCGYGGQNIWQHTTRYIYDETITLSGVGSERTVQRVIPVGVGWDPAKLHVVAYLQTTAGNKEMIQGKLLPMVPDFTVAYERQVRSVPGGNGTAIFNGTVTNIGSSTDVVTLEVTDSFGAWDSDFLVCGDPYPHPGSVQITLDPSESCAFQLRVHTDAAREVREGTCRASSQATTRSESKDLRVFNGSYAVLFVDDDEGFDYETPIKNGLDALLYVYEHWDITNGHAQVSPDYDDMAGFDYVVWQTGWRTGTVITDNDTAAMAAFMDDGGSLFLSSQAFLNQYASPNVFITDYLGVASWVLDRGYTQMNGVAGDPIGDGISLPLSFQYPTWRKGDSAVPGPTASTVFLAPDGSHATVRNTMPDGAKSVFMPSSYNAISQSDPDPNNTRFVLQRIMEWLEPPTPAAVGDDAGSLSGLIDRARPNPFSRRTEIAFELSAGAADAPIRLEIFDIAGRRVAGLFDGVLPAGPHTRVWDGRTEAGEAAGSGVYFARLSTRQGRSVEKLILLH